MDIISSNSMLLMERSINFMWTKQTAILDNIANAETPGYKTKYVTFEETLAEKLEALHDSGDAAGYAARVREAIEDAEPAVHTAEEAVRMDDNGVNVTEQSIELTRNAYQLQYAMNAVNSDFSMLRTVING